MQNQKAKIAPATHVKVPHTFSDTGRCVGPMRSRESDQLKDVWEESINIASYVIYHANGGCHFFSVPRFFSILFLLSSIK